MSVQGNSIGQHIERVGKTRCEGRVVDRPKFTVEQLRGFKPMLSFLNAKDRDVLYLIFVSGKKQKDVQEILGRSQPSLSYDIKRIRKRLKFIFYLDSVFDIFIEFVSNPPDDFNQFEIEVMLLMFYTSSFTMTSDILKVPQVKVRYSYDRCLRRLEEKHMWEIYEIFMIVRDNLNMIRRREVNGSRSLETAMNCNDSELLKEIFVPQ